MKKNSAAKDKKATSSAQSRQWKEIERQLSHAAKEKDTAMRGVRIAAAISRALREINQDPVLVGGSAVEFYTQGAYTTRDIDMLSPGGKELVSVMTRLGFKRLGKDFINDKINIYIEFPGDFLGRGEKARIIRIDNTPLQIISVEDLIIDRLSAYKFWKSGIDGVNAMILMELCEYNTSIVERKASAADVLDAMDYVRMVLEKVIRERIPKDKAAELVEKFIRR